MPANPDAIYNLSEQQRAGSMFPCGNGQQSVPPIDDHGWVNLIIEAKRPCTLHPDRPAYLAVQGDIKVCRDCYREYDNERRGEDLSRPFLRRLIEAGGVEQVHGYNLSEQQMEAE